MPETSSADDYRLFCFKDIERNCVHKTVGEIPYAFVLQHNKIGRDAVVVGV